MPSKNTVKVYIKDGIYHVYNRGVDKRDIFQDEQDYKVFLSFLKEYLTPPPDREELIKKITVQGSTFKGLPRQPKNYHKEVELLAFCLMPNHFHLMIKQLNKESLKNFMKSLATRYSMYFNKKYDRMGSLFQGVYKAALVKDDRQLLHLTMYIHLNPAEIGQDLIKAYSSYADHLRLKNTTWIKPNMILKFFENKTIPEINKVNTYKNFVENYKKDSAKILGKLTLES